MATQPKTNSRFIKSILSTAKETQTRMPWERGATRKGMIARRMTPAPQVLRRA